MKTYLVGGSVRDKLLGNPPNDTDYLVTGCTEEDLLKRGLVKVGQSFPIFLDRESGDEYTLADSLEQDLGRRDLTINAMAVDEEGKLFDPFNGKRDLENKMLRHVSRENFFTDPLRVIRTVRFLVQLPGFQIHPETESLLREVVKTEAYAHLPGERIIKELKRVLDLDHSSIFFRKLMELKALSPHFQELGKVPEHSPQIQTESGRFAWLCSYLSLSELDSLCSRLGIQNDWKEMAGAWIRFRNLKQDPENLLDFYYSIDAFRKPELIESLEKLDPSGMKSVSKFFRVVREIGISSVDQKLSGKDISRAIREERLRVLKENS